MLTPPFGGAFHKALIFSSYFSLFGQKKALFDLAFFELISPDFIGKIDSPSFMFPYLMLSFFDINSIDGPPKFSLPPKYFYPIYR